MRLLLKIVMDRMKGKIEAELDVCVMGRMLHFYKSLAIADKHGKRHAMRAHKLQADMVHTLGDHVNLQLH